MIQKPPRCTWVSANGPSVLTNLGPMASTTVAGSTQRTWMVGGTLTPRCHCPRRPRGPDAELCRLEHERHTARGGHRVGNRTEAGRHCTVGEEPFAAADDCQEDQPPVDVDESGVLQRARELPAAVDLQLTAGLFLEGADALDYVAADDGAVAPVGGLVGQGARHHVLG